MYVRDFDFIWANSFLQKVFVVFGEGAPRRDKLLHQEGNKSDVIWWDKYYDEVKESVNQDVLAGCGHLSLWTVRGAGWGKMLSRHFPLFFERATADRKRGSPAWQQRVWNLSGDCLNFLSSTYSAHPTVCCVKVEPRKISLASTWSHTDGTVDDLI